MIIWAVKSAAGTTTLYYLLVGALQKEVARVSRKNEGRKEFWVFLYSLFSILGHGHALTYYAVCVMDNRKLKMDFLSLPESNGVTLFNTLDASLMGPKM